LDTQRSQTPFECSRRKAPETTLDYHALNAMLNLYDDEGKIQLDKDRMAAKQYFLQHVNQNTVFFHNLREKLDYLVTEGYYEREVLDQYSFNFVRDLFDHAYARNSASRPSSAPSSITPATR
jgi:ribonucleoside-diphosphate reductase alpha chain